MANSNNEEIHEAANALLAAINAPVPVNPTCRISKSKFMSGIKCLKREYLEVHHPELAAVADDGLLQQGIEVGQVAQGAFPGGVVVDGKNLRESIHITRELIANPEIPVIFESTFERSGVLVRVDVLKRNAAGFHLTEVKSTTSIQPEHTDEVSIQKYVVEGSGVQVSGTHLMHLNREYVYDGAFHADDSRAYDLSRLFATGEVQPYSDGYVTRTLDQQFKMLAEPHPPEMEPNSQCDSRSYCEFYDCCRPQWADDDVRWLPIANSKIEALKVQGIASLDQLPGPVALREVFHLTPRECQFALAAKDKRIRVRSELAAELGTLNYPVCFMDFETINPALPLYAGMRPYDHIPFQYSVHRRERPDAPLHHAEFLWESNTDPRAAFARSLCDAVAGAATIGVYYQSFERGRLADLIRWVPQCAQQMTDIQDKLWDLLPIIRRNVYHHAFGGSFSLKYVLPALVPDMSYEDMAVGDGMEAGIAWKKMLSPLVTAQEKNRLRRALLDYCGQDTLAMVRLVETLRSHSS